MQAVRDLNLKSDKTIKTSLLFLRERRWISLSKSSGYHFILGLDRIRELEGFKRKGACEFCIEDIRNFKGFLIGTIYTNLIANQKRRRWLSELKNGCSKKKGHPPPSFYPIANVVISKLLGISISTACEWKNLAKKQKYIKVRKQYESTLICPIALPALRKYDEGESNKLRFRNKKVCEQKPDLISTNLVLKTRRPYQNRMEKNRNILEWDSKGKINLQ